MMKNFNVLKTLFLLVCVGGFLVGYAQKPTYLNHTSANVSITEPFGDDANGTRTQMLFPAGEFNKVPSGMAISTIYFMVQPAITKPGVPKQVTYDQFEVKMGQPSLKQLTTKQWETSGMTTVLSQKSYSVYPVAKNWIAIKLTTPVSYDPSNPLLVDISCGKVSSFTSWAVAADKGGKQYQTHANPHSSKAPSTLGQARYIFGFDLIPMDIDVVGLKFPSPLCQGEEAEVEITVENSGKIDIDNFTIDILVNGLKFYSEQYTGSTIKGGTKSTFKLKEKFSADTSGKFTVTAMVSGRKQSVDQSLILIPSPVGVAITKGSKFNGTFNQGNISNPDWVAHSNTITYEIDPPKGLSNGDYGKVWEFSSVTLQTLKGIAAGKGTWSFTAPGKGNGVVTFTPDKGYSDSTYILSVIAKNIANGCGAPAVERIIYIAPTPEVDFTWKGKCVGEEIEFDNASSIINGQLFYVWDFDDGNSSKDENPNHTYNSFGPYTVKLTATSALGIKTVVTKQVEAHTKPEAIFKVSNECEGEDILFANFSSVAKGGGVIKSLAWDFGDKQTSNANNPVHKYAIPGTYDVKLVVETSLGCFDDTTVKAVQFHSPKADFSFFGTCENRDIEFTSMASIGSSEKLTAQWDFGTSKNGTGNKLTHTYPSNGEYKVKMWVESGFGCKDSITKTIDVQQGPKPEFKLLHDCSLAETQLINLSDDGGTKTTYNWTIDGTSSSDFSPYHTFKNAGFVDVKLEAIGDNGCKSSKFQKVQINPGAKAAFEFDGLCEENQFSFTNKSEGTGITYSWEFGDNTNSKAQNPFKNYDVDKSTLFDVTLVAKASENCSDTLTQQVKVSATPSCGFKAVQGEDRKTFTFVPDEAQHKSYNWVIDGNTITDVSPTFSFDAYNKQYTIQLDVISDDGCGCKDGTLDVITKWSNSIEDLNLTQMGVNVYPIPANDVININWENLEMGTVDQVALYDISGKLIMSSLVDPSSNSIEMETANLNSGIYNLQTMIDGNIYHVKVVITH